MGHHGVSVGDVDGDGLDDFYVSQPDGLPNRLFRNNGRRHRSRTSPRPAGVAVLDRTSQSLFADIDNDGDQDLVLLDAHRPAAVPQRRQGPLHPRSPTPFQFKQPLQGSLTSAAMADYDRDGFLDLYLCAYGYFIGVSEDKAGPPSPYHDALNGSPNVLLRNDGHGRFVDVTDAAGLDREQRPIQLRACLGRLRRRRLARPARRQRLRPQEPLPQRGPRRRTGALQGRGRAGGRRGLRRRHERGLRRLRQRRPPRHLHRQHVDGGRPARDRGSPASSPTRRRRSRDIYRRHARGNSLFRNRGDGTFEDVTLEGARRVRPLGLVVGRARFRQRRLRTTSTSPTACSRATPTSRRSTSTASSGGRWSAQSPLDAHAGHGLRRRLARHQPAAGEQRRAGAARAQRAAAQRRPRRLRRGLGRGRARPRSGRPRPSPYSTTTATATPTSS